MNNQQGEHLPQESELIPLLQKISQQLEELSKSVQDQSVDLENLRYSSALNMQSEFFHKIHKNQLS